MAAIRDRPMTPVVHGSPKHAARIGFVPVALLSLLPALAGGPPATCGDGSASSSRPGMLDRNAPQFMACARNVWYHFGWQTWHREVDREVEEWLKKNAKAGLEEFLQFLRRIYGRPDMQYRFPGIQP